MKGNIAPTMLPFMLLTKSHGFLSAGPLPDEMRLRADGPRLGGAIDVSARGRHLDLRHCIDTTV